VYLGVDEAGKGPVLGPMVAAAVLASPSTLPPGIDDSKRLTPERREALDAAIRGIDDVAVGVAFVDTDEIDRPDTDMNTLTVLGQARAVRAALDDAIDGGLVDAERTEPVRVVADAGDTSEERFARRLGERVTAPADGSAPPPDDRRDLADGGCSPPGARKLPAVDVEAAHGADEDDPLVGAASVVAKVARDARMDVIDAAYPDYAAVGSGYPGDAATRTFLRDYVADHGEVPDCARRSWSTCDDVLAAAEQSGLGDF
jgi:ribonuclease HII